MFKFQIWTTSGYSSILNLVPHLGQVIVLDSSSLSCTSSGEAKSCHIGTFKASATFSSVGYDGETIIRERLSRAIPNLSARLVIVNPCFLITSLILFIISYFLFAKIRLLYMCDIYVSLNNVNGDNIYHLLL